MLASLNCEKQSDDLVVDYGGFLEEIFHMHSTEISTNPALKWNIFSSRLFHAVLVMYR